jgi:thiamine monophosphate kinase
MIPIEGCKFVNVTPPAAIVDNASYTTNEIDTIGYDHCTILVSLGATDIAMAALKVQESDVSGSGFADITGATFASSLPSATDDNKIFAFYIDLRGRKRYLDMVATAGDGTAGTFASAVAVLSRANQLFTDATNRGLGGQVTV